MQKIIEDREKRKQKWIRIGKISAIAAVLLFLLVRLLCSSYAFCNWYLPLASYSLGIRISADEVKFTPFSSKRHLNFRGLQVEVKDKMIFTAKRFKTKISFFDLIFCQEYTLDNVTVEKASLVISDLRRTKGEKESSGLERIRIGSVTVNDLSVRYAPERSAVFGKAFFDEVRINSMLPGQMNTVELRSILAWDMPDSTMVNLPVTSRIDFMLDEKLSPVQLKVNFETQKLKGNLYEHDLSDLWLKASLDCKIDDNDKVTVNQATLQQFSEDREVFKLEALGYYDIAAQIGSMQVSAAANRMNVPLLIPLQYVPEDLNLRFAGTLIKQGNRLSLESDLDLDAKSIKKQNREIIQAPKIHFASLLTWDIESKDLTFSKCSLEAFSNNVPILTAKTSEHFAISINQEASWNLAQKNSSLQVQIKDCPLSLFNEFMPLQVKNGIVSCCFDLNVDAVKKSLCGTIKGSANNIELQYEGATVFKKYPMHFQGELRSNALNNITELDIANASISCGEKTFATLNASGKIHLKSETMDLHGVLNADLLTLLEHTTQARQEKYKKLLTCLGECTKQNKHAIDLKFSAKTQTVDFSLQSILNKLSLPQMERTLDLTLKCGGSIAQKENSQLLQIKDFSISSPGDFELSGSAEMQLTEAVYSAKLNLARISPEVFRGIWLICEQQDTTARNWLRKLYYKNLNATANIIYTGKDHALNISNVKVSMEHENGGSGVLTLNSPLIGSCAPLQFNDVQATADIKQFPLEFINTFVSDNCRIKIMPAKISCLIDLAFTNQFRDIPFRAKGSVDNFRIMDLQTPYGFGKCDFEGEADLNDFFHKLSYRNAIWILEKDGLEQRITGSGEQLLNFPYTNDLQFQIPQLNSRYVATFFPGFSTLVDFSEAEAETKIHVLCNEDFDFLKVQLDQEIKKLSPRFPDNAPYAPPVMHGNAHLDMIYRAPEQILSLNKCYLNLFNEKETLIYNAELNGEWDGSKNNRSTCTFTSRAADLKTAYLAYKATRQKKDEPGGDAAATVSAAPQTPTDPEPEQAENTLKKRVSQEVASIKDALDHKKEPGAIDLNDFSTNLQVDLKNWMYTDHIVLTMTGTFTVNSNICHAKQLKGTLNKAEYLLDAYADLGKDDGWEMKVQWNVTKLDMVPLFKAFSSKKEMEKEISGTLDQMELYASTKGITNSSLDKNLKCNVQCAFSNLSLPLIKEDDDEATWQFFLTPLTIFPRLYDLIPEGSTRDSIQQFLGGAHIDVLMGKKNIELDRGVIKLQNGSTRKTDLAITKFLFTGPVIEVASKNFMLNPVHDRINAEILTKFGGAVFPIKLSGPIREPEIELPSILSSAFKSTLKKLNVFEKDDPVWQFEEQTAGGN